MRLTLKAKVILLALVPVILFALVLSGTAARVLQNLAADEVARPASVCCRRNAASSSTISRSHWAR